MKKLLLFALFIGASLLYEGCESWRREIHTFQSEVSGGLYRRVTLLDYNGDTVKVWEGKFDVQFTDRNSAYWDQDGKRVMISGGIIVNEEL